MRSIGLALLFALFSTTCFAQGAVNQTGSVVNGHAARWFDDRTIGDAGPASGGNANVGITELAIVGKGLPFCIYDAPITNAAGFHSMCLGHTRDTFVFVFDGVEYEFPFVKGGMIGNSPSEVGDIMCFGNHQGTFAIKCGDPAPVTDPPNYGRITNLYVTNNLTVDGTFTINNIVANTGTITTLNTDTLKVTGDGIIYATHSATNKFGFSWDGSFIHGWVNGTDVGQLATVAWVQGALGGYATQAWVLSQGYITGASLSGYATQQWVLDQGYTTMAAVQGWVNGQGFATQSWVLGQGFVTGGPYMAANPGCGISYPSLGSSNQIGFQWTTTKLMAKVDCSVTPGALATESWVSANFATSVGGGMPNVGRDLIVHNVYQSGISRNEKLIFQVTDPFILYGEWKSIIFEMYGQDLFFGQGDTNGVIAAYGGHFTSTGLAPGSMDFVLSNGSFFGLNTTPPSDLSLKKEVKPYTHGLAELRQLVPISFQYNGKGPTIADGVTRRGVDAAQVEAVLPELITKRKLGPKPTDTEEWPTVDVPGFTFVVINAIKEITARLEAVEAKVSPRRKGGS